MTAKDNLIIGSHLSIAGGLHNALLEARRFKMQCVQLFVANQRQWQLPPLKPEDIAAFEQTREKTGLVPLVAHSKYLINLATADAGTYQKSLHALDEEYCRCNTLGIHYLVLHPGAHKDQGEKRGLAKIITSLNKVTSGRADSSCMILLETTAGSGTSLGYRFGHLAEIIEGVERPELFGVCLDTAHIFAAGYDIRTPVAYEETIRQFDATIGLAALKVIHANDSKTDLGSGVDRHEHIGKGKLGREAFRNLVTDPRVNHLPFVLETPKGISPGGRDYDKLNMAALRRLGF